MNASSGLNTWSPHKSGEAADIGNIIPFKRSWTRAQVIKIEMLIPLSLTLMPIMKSAIPPSPM
jgi:hypothetical protein